MSDSSPGPGGEHRLTSVWCILLNHGLLESRDIVRVSELCQWTAWLLCDPMFFWESTYDPESGRTFFYNIRTNESQWDIPGPFREWIYDMNIEDPDVKSLNFIMMQHTLQRFTTFVESEISDSLPAIRAAEEARIEAEDNLESTLEEQANLHDELEKEKTKATRAQEYVRKAMQNFVKKQNESAKKRKELEAKIETLKKRVEADQEKIKGFAELQGFVDSLNEKRQESERLKEDLEKKLAEASEKIHDLETRGRESKCDTEGLRDDLQKAQSTIAEKDELIRELQNQLTKVSSQLERTSEDVCVPKKEIEELNTKLRLKDNFVATLEMETKTEREILREDTAQRCTELETLLAERRDLISSLNEAKTSLEQERLVFKKDRDEIVTKLESEACFERESIELKKTQELLRQSLEDGLKKDESVMELNETRELLHRSEEESHVRDEIVSRLEFEMERNHVDHQEKRDEISKLEMKLRETRTENEMLDKARTESVNHQKQRNDIDRLEMELSEARRQNQEFVSRASNGVDHQEENENIDRLEMELSEVRGENEELINQVRSSGDERKHSEREEELIRLREEVRQCLQSIRDSSEEFETFESTLRDEMETKASRARDEISLEMRSNEILAEQMTHTSREFLDLRAEMLDEVSSTDSVMRSELERAQQLERAAQETAASTHLKYMQTEDRLRQELILETRRRENDLREKDDETDSWKKSVLSAASDQAVVFSEIEGSLRDEIVAAERRHKNEIDMLRRDMEVKFERRLNRVRESVLKDSNSQLHEIEVNSEDQVLELRNHLESMKQEHMEIRVEMSTAEAKQRSDLAVTALRNKFH